MDGDDGFANRRRTPGRQWCKWCKQPKGLASWQFRILAIFACVLVTLAGCGLVGYGSTVMEVAARCTQCACRIRDFQADRLFPADNEPIPTCKTHGGFVVTALCEDSQFVLVENFTASLGHSAFVCCPIFADDFCSSQDPVTLRFCDNFKTPGCPSAPWDCYFERLEEKLAAGGSLPPEDLIVGNIMQRAVAFLGTGVATFFVGFCLLFWVTRGFWFRLIKRFRGKSARELKEEAFVAAPTQEEKLSIARSLPYKQRSPAMFDLLSRTAAVTIQRFARGRLARRRVRQMLQRLVKDGDPRGRKLLNLLFDDGPTEGAQDAYSRGVRKLARRFEKRGQANSLLRAQGLADAPPSPGSGLLYDTGGTTAFRRTVRSRIVSAPGDPVERIEVALAKASPMLDGAIDVTPPSAGSKALVRRRPPSVYTDLYGIRLGHQLVKVGELEWPETPGEELLLALASRPRPIFLVFEREDQGEESPASSPSRGRRQPMANKAKQQRHSAPELFSPPGSPSAAGFSFSGSWSYDRSLDRSVASDLSAFPGLCLPGVVPPPAPTGDGSPSSRFSASRSLGSGTPARRHRSGSP